MKREGGGLCREASERLPRGFRVRREPPGGAVRRRLRDQSMLAGARAGDVAEEKGVRSSRRPPRTASPKRLPQRWRPSSLTRAPDLSTRQS